jgi:hypothetical protein
VISHLVAAVIGNYLTTAFIVGLLVAIGQIWLRRPLTAGQVSDIVLNSYLLYGIGVAQILNFVARATSGQLELACYSLGLGVAAIIVHGKRANLTGKLAVVLASSAIGYGAAGAHIFSMIAHHGFAANSTGLLLIMDIVISTFGIELMICQALARPRPARAGATLNSVLPTNNAVRWTV